MSCRCGFFLASLVPCIAGCIVCLSVCLLASRAGFDSGRRVIVPIFISRAAALCGASSTVRCLGCLWFCRWHCDEFQYAQSLRQFVQVLLLYPPRGLKIVHNMFDAICEGISMNVGVHENPYFSPKQCSQVGGSRRAACIESTAWNECRESC